MGQALGAEEMFGGSQLRLEGPLERQILSQTLLYRHLTQQADLHLLDLIPAFAYSAQIASLVSAFHRAIILLAAAVQPTTS
jgi:hypothetical protein